MSASVALHAVPLGYLAVKNLPEMPRAGERMQPALGIAGALDYLVGPRLQVGLASRVTFDVVSEHVAGSGATQVDLLLRTMGLLPLSSRVVIGARLAAGVSRIYLPSWHREALRQQAMSQSDPAGIVLEGGVTFTFRATPRLDLIAGGGYLFGLQRGTMKSSTTSQRSELSTRFLFADAGLAIRF
jgi:hypothetical protein